MGYIEEPEGVDFIIQSEPLTDIERAMISEHIRKKKEEYKRKEAKQVEKKGEPQEF